MISLIRQIILKSPIKIIYLPYNVLSYQTVIKLWKCFLKGSTKLPDIDTIFNFHSNHPCHVLLYYSKNLNDCLLLCKINNEYMNIRLPMEYYSNKSFVAIYC